MSSLPSTGAAQPPDSEYEDLLGQWSDLEAFASVLLARPLDVRDFAPKVRQCELWLADLVAHDSDAALYLMFQLASTSTVGYSASHALVCAALCHVLGRELRLSPAERSSLVCAAFTMNIAMTALQDALSLQHEPLRPEQEQAVQQHPQAGLALLQRLGVGDPLWLSAVGGHHALPGSAAPLATLAPARRLVRILDTIDRYAAMISPRKSRAGRSATDSVRAVVGGDAVLHDEVGVALTRTVGLCPPGTFVRLDNGEVAAVLRRTPRSNAPLVASVLTAQGAPLAAPRLYHTGLDAPRIQCALARSAVGLELNHRMMVRLGLFAAQRSITLRG